METPGIRSWVGVDLRGPPGFVASAFLCDLSLGHGAGTLTKGRQGARLPRPKQASAEPAEELEGYCLSGSIAEPGAGWPRIWQTVPCTCALAGYAVLMQEWLFGKVFPQLEPSPLQKPLEEAMPPETLAWALDRPWWCLHGGCHQVQPTLSV